MNQPRPCHICGEPEFGAQGLCEQHHAELRARVHEREQSVSTPREAALAHIRYYVYRGDSEEYLRLSHMGHYGAGSRVSIGSYEHPPTRIVVTEVHGQPVDATFSLHELYEELVRERDGTWQLDLFAVAGQEAIDQRKAS